MSEAESPVTRGSSSTAIRIALVLVIAAAIVYALCANIDKFGAILMVAFGFGGVVMVHEFGHFIVGKMTGMRVTAFSIGFPPVLLGFKRTMAGMRIRVLPTLIPKEGGGPDEGALDFTFGRGGEEWETEYCIGLIPIGGYVALLGQEDFGAAERDPDPRSFMNKPLLPRIAVILAGVTFNVISALIIFMIIFHNGIKLQAPVIGDVIPNSPAAQAGLRSGDEIVAIDGDRFIDYMNIALAGALGDVNDPVNLVVKRTLADGRILESAVAIVPKVGKVNGAMSPMRVFGVSQSPGLLISRLADANDRKQLFVTTGLKGNDLIVAIDGKPVKDGLQFQNMLENLLTRTVTLTAERTDPNTKVVTRHSVKLPLGLTMTTDDFEKGYTLNSVYGMVPRLAVIGVPSEPKGKVAEIKKFFSSLLGKKKSQGDKLKKGDVIVKVGDYEYPTYTDLRRLLTEYTNAMFAAADKNEEFDPKMKVVVERVVDGQAREVMLNMVPAPADKRHKPSMLGFNPGLDANSPAISHIIETPDGLKPGTIPAGAVISSVGGRKVASFYDVIAAIRSNADRTVAIEWQKGGESGEASLAVPMGGESVTVKSAFAVVVPIDEARRLYKADNPLQAIVMGWKRTELFIKQAVVTLERLVSGALSPSTLSGPVGIVTATYNIAAGKDLTTFFYWLGLISASIAVMNLLPLPILDGGLIVLMLVEKIKGSPISRKAQEMLAYIGWGAILLLMVYVTYNDIRMFFLN
jgi:regulator of sigma E protease